MVNFQSGDDFIPLFMTLRIDNHTTKWMDWFNPPLYHTHVTPPAGVAQHENAQTLLGTQIKAAIGAIAPLSKPWSVQQELPLDNLQILQRS
jgi:hypothetical protein